MRWGECLVFQKSDTDPLDENDWAHQFEWFTAKLELFDKVFRERIRGLDPLNPCFALFETGVWGFDPHVLSKTHTVRDPNAVKLKNISVARYYKNVVRLKVVPKIAVPRTHATPTFQKPVFGRLAVAKPSFAVSEPPPAV